MKFHIVQQTTKSKPTTIIRTIATLCAVTSLILHATVLLLSPLRRHALWCYYTSVEPLNPNPPEPEALAIRLWTRAL